jgi:glycosyltransferase involved in cell wall biosynthesis
MPTSDTVVFVPAWNEEANLPAVLDELRAVLPEADVLVVDDGSTDGTAAVARAHGADVLSVGENRGLRAGIAAGYREALERGYAYCGRVDADGQHPAEELARLLERVRAGGCDAAVGSRFAEGEGYAVNRAAMALMAEPYASGAPEVEALLRLQQAGLRVEEVAVHMRERQGGESKLQGSKAVKLVLTVIGTLLFFRWLGRHRR